MIRTRLQRTQKTPLQKKLTDIQFEHDCDCADRQYRIVAGSWDIVRQNLLNSWMVKMEMRGNTIEQTTLTIDSTGVFVNLTTYGMCEIDYVAYNPLLPRTFRATVTATKMNGEMITLGVTVAAEVAVYQVIK